jgi:hypothetical protein
VERARSHHQMMVMRGHETRSFGAAIDELLHSEALRRSRRCTEETSSYVTRGEYARILDGYYKVFPRAQICVVFTDELEREPARLLGHLHEFLGVSVAEMPSNIEARYREGASRRRFGWLDPDGIQSAAAKSGVARALWHAIPDSARRSVDRRFGGLAYRIDLWNQSGSSSHSHDHPEALRALRAHYEQDSAKLAEMLGRPVPWL